ncbi:MAG: carbon-nitrogen hydrolase family protein [Desulfovibrio sp.]|jgi:nitrilase|nr:carbon-nitrogen hydrolase family protein [Desulfovibrio sp.]
MADSVRVAVVQAAPTPFDKASALAKVVSLTRDAAAQGARIVLFPEAYIPCYPRGMTFGANVGKRTDEGRKDFRRYYEQAVDVPGDEIAQLGQIAAETGVYLVVGVIERDGGSLHCAVAFLGPDGAYLGKHRKLKPTGSERLVWSQGDGSTLPVIETPYGKMCAVICWENYMPLLRAAMYAKGTTIYLAPTADARDNWQASMRHIALEGRCFVLACNQFQTKDMVPTDLSGYGDLAGEPDVMCRGGSAIIDPMGNYLAGPLYGEEGILLADLDLGRLAEARFDFDVVGHYARNDVFTLIVDERPKRGAVFLRDDDASQEA